MHTTSGKKPFGVDEEAPTPLAVQARLKELEQAAELLEDQLREREEALLVHRQFQNELLASRSWRITRPLRKLKTLLGASAPLESVPSWPPEKEPEAPWDSLIPTEGLPPEALVASPDVASRSNRRCEIIRPECMLAGLLPPELLQPGNPSLFSERRTPLYLAHGVSPARLAFIGSEELATELAFEAEVTLLREDDWEQQLDGAGFDFLLLEPVLHVGNRDWRNAMCVDGRSRRRLEAVLERFGDLGIPRVLWYRAAPEAVARFGWLGGQVDAMYAVDPTTSSALGSHPDIQAAGAVPVLEPAIQPAMYNPLRTWEQLAAQGFTERVLFDGWLDLLEGADADPLVQAFRDDRLLVAESEWEFGGVRLDDAANFKRNAAGCLGTVGKLAMAKMVGAEIFRSGPLVPDWRRQLMMLRSAACGTIIAEAEAAAGSSAARWGPLPLRKGAEGLPGMIAQILSDPLARDRLRHQAFREIFTRHCLADRLNTIAADLGLQLQFGRRPATVACLLVTMRPERLAACLDRFRRDRYPHKELVVVLHGDEASVADARSLIRPGEAISIFQLGKGASLGDCLNFAAAQTDAEYWAKVDDDDLYGPEYLSDIMLYRRAVDFPLGGKCSAFVYSQAGDQIRWDRRHAASRAWQFRRGGSEERVYVAGGTLVGKTKLLRELPFSATRRRGSDSELVRSWHAAGHDFVAFDYFNFALYRSDAPDFHTWNADMAGIRERSTVVGPGAEVETMVFA